MQDENDHEYEEKIHIENEFERNKLTDDLLQDSDSEQNSFEQDIEENSNDVTDKEINGEENGDIENEEKEDTLCEVHLGNLSIYKNGVQLKNYYRKFEVTQPH